MTEIGGTSFENPGYDPSDWDDNVDDDGESKDADETSRSSQTLHLRQALLVKASQ